MNDKEKAFWVQDHDAKETDPMDFCGELCLFAANLIKKAKQSTWIPVTERLPDEDGTYLVITNYGTVTIAKYYTSKTFPATQIMPQYTSVAKWQSNRNPTHWMPLPEPPKEE